jgi:hypothetical protein
MVGNEDNVPYSIPLENLYEFVTTELPSESELKKIYEDNFVLNEITEDGYYVFIKEGE